MIDCEVKFGAYVPTVPKIYQEAAVDDDHLYDFEKEIVRVSECYVGPTWTSLTLRSIQRYNHDTSLFEFALPDPKAYLNLPVTAHLLIRGITINEDDGDVHHHVRPYTAVDESQPGTFTIMVKLYQEWGVPEAQQRRDNKFFLFAKTDHSYKPPGKVSTFVHSLKVGDTLDFKHNQHCLGKISYPFSRDITSITMIAVGAGVAPMIRILRALLESDKDRCEHVTKIRLLYGVRTVSDILQREVLDRWHDESKANTSNSNNKNNNSSSSRFEVCYCIGSRWNNIHFHAKQNGKDCRQKLGPPLPEDWETVPEDRKELGWVDGDKVKLRGASTANDDGHRIFICGLPGVYLKLVGSRFDSRIEEGTQLHNLGYRDFQVVKF